jgi:hypothetical protein
MRFRTRSLHHKLKILIFPPKRAFLSFLSETTLKIFITQTGRPDQVHNCTITNISMTSMSLRCSEGFNGGLQQQFMLEVRDLQTNELRANYSSPVPRFTVNSLVPSTIYLASVYAFNTKGRSDPTTVQAAMLRMPEKQPTGEKGKQGFLPYP